MCPGESFELSGPSELSDVELSRVDCTGAIIAKCYTCIIHLCLKESIAINFSTKFLLIVITTSIK